MAFGKEAVRSQAKLKIAFEAMSGGGKTFSALLMAKELGTKIGLLDSENESALKTAGRKGIPPFLHQPMPNPSLQEYIAQTDAAAEDGVEVLIYDSWSHSWTAALEAVDAQGGDNFKSGWKNVSPLVKKLIQKMVSYPGHCIATMRLDSEWSLDKDERGKVVPQKIGMKAVAGKGAEYEFDWVLRITPEAKVVVMKTRNGELLPLGAVYDRSELPAITRRLVAWLNEGAPQSARDAMAERIRFAGTKTALSALPAEIKRGVESGALTAEDRQFLIPLYKAREAELEETGF